MRLRLARAAGGAAVGYFFGTVACGALESTPLPAVLAQSFLTLAGVALGAGYPPALSGPSERLFAALAAFARPPAGRRSLLAGLGAGLGALSISLLPDADPFTGGALPPLLFYLGLGAGLGFPRRIPKGVLLMAAAGLPAALMAGAYHYDRLCNYGRAASCAAAPAWGVYFHDALGFLALLTMGAALLPLHLGAPVLPVFAATRWLGERRSWGAAAACALVFVVLGRPGAERTAAVNLLECVLPALALGYALGRQEERHAP